MWNVAGSGNWNTAANWLDTTTGLAKTPTAVDDVTINQNGPLTVTIQAGDSIAVHSLQTSTGNTLTISGGSFGVAAASTLGGDLSLGGGTLTGDNLTLGGTSLWSGGLIAGNGTLANSGTFDVAAGVATFTLHNAFNNLGTLDVQSGTLSITGPISQVSNNTLTAGTWDVANNATLNFGATPNLTTNQATVGLGGPNAVFTQFATVTNDSGSLTLTGGANFAAAGDLSLGGSLSLDTGALQLNSHQLNIASGGSLSLGNANGLTNPGPITNAGTIAYSGAGTLSIGAFFTNSGGTINVQSGGITMTGSAPQNSYQGSNFVVSQGAVFDFGHGTSTVTGTLTGSGGGAVQLASGVLNVGSAGATFKFPSGLFQVSSSQINGSGVLTNDATGFITVSGSSATSFGAAVNNAGNLTVTGSGGLGLSTNPLTNEAGGVIAVQSSGGISGGLNHALLNAGAINVSVTGTTTIATGFDNTGGAINVQSGTLLIERPQNGVNDFWSGGALQAASGATLEVFNLTITMTGSYTGSGSGTVLIGPNSSLQIGSSASDTASFAFSSGLFQFGGGVINGLGTLTNAAGGFLTVAGSNGGSFLCPTQNQGTITVSGSVGLGLAASGANQPG